MDSEIKADSNYNNIEPSHWSCIECNDIKLSNHTSSDCVSRRASQVETKVEHSSIPVLIKRIHVMI